MKILPSFTHPQVVPNNVLTKQLDPIDQKKNCGSQWGPETNIFQNIFLCVKLIKKKKNSYRFKITSGWVNYIIFIFGWIRGHNNTIIVNDRLQQLCTVSDFVIVWKCDAGIGVIIKCFFFFFLLFLKVLHNYFVDNAHIC